MFAKAIYSVTETLGVASIGYGAYLALVDNDLSRFVRMVKAVPGLTPLQKDQLAFHYLKEGAERARTLRKVRVISHGLTAALNFIDGATMSNPNLSEALYFLGGVNVLAALGFALSQSDEEKALNETVRPAHVKVSFFVGPVTGLAMRF